LSSEGERSLTTRGIEVRDNEGSKGLTMAALPKEEAVAVTGVWVAVMWRSSGTGQGRLKIESRPEIQRRCGLARAEMK
jgi:hypothetical protein